MKKILIWSATALAGLFLIWYFFIALKPVPVEQAKIIQAYQHQTPKEINFQLSKVTDHLYEFNYESYDGEKVYGKISYPKENKAQYPVVLGIPAMGRSYVRWFQDSFKGRPTVTKVNELQKIADSNGYVVIAIDPRFHGKRKKPEKTLRSIMNDLHFFGDKEPYQEMIVNTVKDYRVLLDWVVTQPNLKSSEVTVIGYSMGGQIALILGALEERVSKVISIVPPFVDDKIAITAPKNLTDKLGNKEVILITVNDDENASIEENNFLFNSISSENKKHIKFEGGHILPDDYPAKLELFM